MAPRGVPVFAIIAYNPDLPVLAGVLRALDGQRTLIIDNSPTTGTLSSLQGAPELTVVRPGSNLGFGGGANVAFEWARRAGAAWTVIMNQDLTLTKVGIRGFVKRLGTTDIALGGPFIGSIDRVRYSTVYPATTQAAQSPRYVSGSFLAVRMDVYDRIGGMDDRYFMYYEDAEYSLRAVAAGFPVGYLPVGGIRHDDATSLGRGSFLHEYYLARNHVMFVSRHAPLAVKLHEALRLPKTMAEYRRVRNTGALAGIRDALRNTYGQYGKGAA